MVTAPSTARNRQSSAAPVVAQRTPMAIPFPRAARQKQIQAFSQTFTLSAAASTAVAPILLPAAGFLRRMRMYCQISSSGNSATVANPTTGDLPFNAIASMQITNASGDTLYVSMNGYFYYLISKYSGTLQPPFNDPRNTPSFTALTTGAGATAGTGNFFLPVDFEQDPRDAFGALPNLASNKSYQVLLQLASIASIWSGGTAPNGTVTLTITIVLDYWGQPNAVNGAGIPQETAPIGVGSVSLWRVQTVTMSAGTKITQLVNVGNVIKSIGFVLYSTATPSIRTSTDWPGTSYIRLNNDQLLYKPTAFWLDEMRKATGFGVTAGTLDTANNLDTGVYWLTDFQCQHGAYEPDGPRDQWLPTLDSTLLQHEGNAFGAAASVLWILTNEIKPISAPALYTPSI